MLKNHPQSTDEPDNTILSNFKFPPYKNLFSLLTRWTFIHKFYVYTKLQMTFVKIWRNQHRVNNQVNNNLSSSSEQQYKYLALYSDVGQWQDIILGCHVGFN